MFDRLIRDFQVLQKIDSLIGRIWLAAMARRFGLLAFATLIAAFGLGMANVAAFLALQPPVGPVWAAVIVATFDLVLAAVVLLVSSKAGPGPEMQMAFDMRKVAIEAIQVDARELKTAVDALGREIREAKESIAGFVHNPLDSAAQRLLIPAALSIIKGLRARKEAG